LLGWIDLLVAQGDAKNEFLRSPIS
jgi:hypothetical protein